MARIARKFLDARLKLASRCLNMPEGPYPTVGQLLLDHNICGYSVCVVANSSGGQQSIATGLTASECVEFLGGLMEGAYMAERLQRLGVVIVEQPA